MIAPFISMRRSPRRAAAPAARDAPSRRWPDSRRARAWEVDWDCADWRQNCRSGSASKSPFLWEKHGLLVAIDGLPVRIPIRNRIEPFARAIRAVSHSLRAAPQIMRVRIDRQHVQSMGRRNRRLTGKSRAPAGISSAPSCSSCTSMGRFARRLDR